MSDKKPIPPQGRRYTLQEAMEHTNEKYGHCLARLAEDERREREAREFAESMLRTMRQEPKPGVVQRIVSKLLAIRPRRKVAK